ncbi:MAG: transposase family protein [Euryarchaeota archaeon]|nr:transposase family protein [Euryarchaeota archaeon]
MLWLLIVGPLFNLNRSNACRNVQKLIPIFEMFPKGITLWLDLGFTGVDNDYPDACVRRSKKKPRGKELTGEEKAQNKVICSIRVLVEHAIGGIKRMQMTTDKFCNKKFRILLMIKLCYFHVGYGIIT